MNEIHTYFMQSPTHIKRKLDTALSAVGAGKKKTKISCSLSRDAVSTLVHASAANRLDIAAQF